MREIDPLKLNDFLEAGRELEVAIQIVGESHQKNNQRERAEISECRDMAVGILAIICSSMEDLLENAPFDPQLAYCLACIVAFSQGAAVSSSLIAQAQYMKAAAVLKQDIEFLARFRESVDGRAVQGRTPQMSSVPNWARIAYGEVNKIAHPANFEEMGSVLSSSNGDFSIPPTRQAQTELALYRTHVWNCIEISGAAIELFALLIEPRPASAKAAEVLEASRVVLAQVVERANHISDNWISSTVD